MDPKISVNVEGYQVKVKMSIAVCDANGNDVLNLKPREYVYDIEKTHSFYLRKIRNFIYKSTTNPMVVIGKTTRAKWKAIQQKIENYFSENNIPIYAGIQPEIAQEITPNISEEVKKSAVKNKKKLVKENAE